MTTVAWWGWVVAVAAGATGALLRTALVRRLARETVPIGVLAANTLASAVGGAVVALRGSLDPVWVLVLVGGFCGGLSTLSTLAVDTVLLWVGSHRRAAVANVALNVVAGLAAAGAAYALVA